MIVYSKKNNDNSFKEFLIPRYGEIVEGDTVLHITIDNINVEFTVRKMLIKGEPDMNTWEILNDYTFPSSLLNEFIRTSHNYKDEKL